MFTKFHVEESPFCQCGTSPMTAEHHLHNSQTLQNLRAETWPADTPVREKINCRAENPQSTAAYVWATRVPVWTNDNEEEEKYTEDIQCTTRAVLVPGRLLVRAPDSWSKGCEFESRQKRPGEFSSPGLSFCADSYSVSVPPPCYRNGTQKAPVILPKVHVAGYA